MINFIIKHFLNLVVEICQYSLKLFRSNEHRCPVINVFLKEFPQAHVIPLIERFFDLRVDEFDHPLVDLEPVCLEMPVELLLEHLLGCVFFLPHHPIIGVKLLGRLSIQVLTAVDAILLLGFGIRVGRLHCVQRRRPFWLFDLY